MICESKWEKLLLTVIRRDFTPTAGVPMADLDSSERDGHQAQKDLGTHYIEAPAARGSTAGTVPADGGSTVGIDDRRNVIMLQNIPGCGNHAQELPDIGRAVAGLLRKENVSCGEVYTPIAGAALFGRMSSVGGNTSYGTALRRLDHRDGRM